MWLPIMIIRSAPVHADEIIPVRNLDAAMTLNGHSGNVYALAFSRDGNQLVSGGSDSTLRIWSVATGEHKDRMAHKDPIYAVVFAPSGDLCYSGGWESAIRVWTTKDWQEKKVLPLSNDQTVSSLAISPDGKLLACALGRSVGEILFWDLTSLKSGPSLRRHMRMVVGLAFALDGKWLVSSDSDGVALLWNVEDKRRVVTCKGHDHPLINSVAIAPGDKSFATGGEDGNVLLWEIPTGKQISSLPKAGAVKRVMFSRNGYLFVAQNESSGGHISVWDIKSSKCVARFLAHPAALIRCFALSPDETLLATGGEDEVIRLWRTNDFLPKK
jgi:WD40 repeat protein